MSYPIKRQVKNHMIFPLTIERKISIAEHISGTQKEVFKFGVLCDKKNKMHHDESLVSFLAQRLFGQHSRRANIEDFACIVI